MSLLLFVLAQAAAAAAPAAQPPAPPRTGVVSYGAEFFAASRPNTALEMVQRLPGFALDTGDSVRGYEGAAGNVLVDGQRPTTKTDDLGELLKRIPAGAVDHVDVIRGGAPGIDMHGKSVIANIVRKSGGTFRGLVVIADVVGPNRNFPQARLEGSGRAGPATWEGGLLMGASPDDGYGDGPRKQTDASGKLLQFGDIHMQGVSSQVTLNGAAEVPLTGGRLRVNARISFNPYDSDETDHITFPAANIEVEHDDDNIFQTEAGGRYTRGLGARANIELVALRQDKHELVVADFRAPGDAELFRLETRNAETIMRGVLTFQQSPALSWEAGGEGAYNTLDSKTRFSRNGAAEPLPAANVFVEEKRGEIFAKGVWRPIAALTVEGGVREEGSQIGSSGDVVLNKSLYFTKPRLTLAWAPDENNQVRLRYERVVGQLDFTAFVASQALSSGVLGAGNPNLEPEKAWVSEIAYERRFLGAGDLVLTYRHSEITDVVDRAPFAGFDAPANIGSGTKDEEIVNLTLPLDRLGLKGVRVNGQSTWRQSSVVDPATRQARAIAKLHPIDWEIHVTHDVPDLKLNWGVDLFGGWREDYYRAAEIEHRKLGAYLSVFAEWKPRRDIAVRVSVDNIAEHGIKRTFEEYGGPRGAAPLLFVETRDPHYGREFFFRVRKTFGA
jgi:outer membrane receptor protein involved in Fe transport